MGTNTQQVFKALVPETVPVYLCEQICQALSQERMRRERMRLMLSSLSGASSIAGLAFSIPALSHAAVTSGFTSYAPLLMSDHDLALGVEVGGDADAARDRGARGAGRLVGEAEHRRHGAGAGLTRGEHQLAPQAHGL